MGYCCYRAANEWGVGLLTYDDGRTLPQYRLHRDVGYVPLGIARRSVNPVEASEGDEAMSDAMVVGASLGQTTETRGVELNRKDRFLTGVAVPRSRV